MSHIEYKQIDPITSGILKILVKDGTGALVSDAVATAGIYNPHGIRIVSNVGLSNMGSGVYHLPVAAEWSSSNGVPIIGLFAALITITRSTQVRTKRFKYLVDFTP
jgi:hypothetical protein